MHPETFGRLTALVLITACGAAAPRTALGQALSFNKSALQGETSDDPTALQFGPDGRLYVAQQNGIIKIYTIVRAAANDYAVSATQTLTLIQDLPSRDTFNREETKTAITIQMSIT